MPRRILFAAFLALAAGVSGCKENSAPAAEGGGKAAAVDAGGAAVAKAEVNLPGVDSGSLTPRERVEWSKWVSEMPSPCADVAVPIAQCITEHRSCSRCVPAAKYLIKLMHLGKPRAIAEAAVKSRFVPVDIPVDGSPSKGADNAPVTIIEFADFQCPGCAQEVKIIDNVLEKLNGSVRVLYKFAALEKHPRAEAAARAAIAAWNQGKFWEMHHRLFEVTRAFEHSPPPFEQADLEGYAKDLHLDMAKFIEDLKAPATNKRFEGDMKLFEKYQLGGTPSIYINGTPYTFEEDPDLLARVEEVLSEVTGKAPTPPPGSSTAPAPRAPGVDGGARPDAKAP